MHVTSSFLQPEDISVLGMLVANMVEMALRSECPVTARSDEERQEHDFQNSTVPQGKTGVHIHPPVDDEPSTPQPRKYGTPIRASGEGVTIRLVIRHDQNLGRRSGTVRRFQRGKERFQSSGGRSFDAKSWGC